MDGAMATRRAVRNDARLLVNIGLLVTAFLAALTGWVADLWDLHDFFYHRYAGYAMVGLGLAHVVLYWRQFVGYIRWRVGKRRRPTPAGLQARQSLTVTDVLRAPLSRRGFVGLLAGGLGGFVVARGLRPRWDIPYGSDVGEVYHEWSKPKLLSLLGTVGDWGTQPALYKTYKDAERYPLPEPDDFQGLYTETAIEKRRSVRDFSGQPITLMQLSRLLRYTGGINAQRWGHSLRAAPSAGALYPIECYPVLHRVDGLEQGVYHYAVQEHQLELLKAGAHGGEIVRHGLMQQFLGEANLVLVFTAVFQRLRWKYQERSYRYALLETGHLGQNVYLAATSMGLGACAVGAFGDDGVNRMLGVDGQEEAALYLFAVGTV
jgi:SagB-type dehydrogenase family enzyme